MPRAFRLFWCRTSRMALGLGFVTLSLVACSKTEFQRQHERAVRGNPAVVELQIRTAGGRTKYKPSELVEYEELYTSKYPGQWHVETSETPGYFGTVYLSDGKSIWIPQGRGGYNVCCSSKHVWLNLEDPTRLPAVRIRQKDGKITPAYRGMYLPKIPGKYQMYVTTERVFSRDESTTTYEGKGHLVTSSNILDLEVVD
jgi:hypothetical protein